MDKLVNALVPALVASLALQQLLELLDPALEILIKAHKKWILALVSLVVGLGLSFGLGMRLLAPFGFTRADWLDGILTALFLTGGTKGFNDLFKWLGYLKEAAKQSLQAGVAARV
jgi:hypothetical protein